MRFAIASNGFADGPAQALRDYLVDRAAQVTTIFHPLTREQGTEHVLSRYEGGRLVDERRRRVPLAPPVSYVADPFVPLFTPRVDAWFGFNPLACARGIASRAPFVALWSVDFVPDRFGRGTIATRIYDRFDRFACVRADARVELSEAAREGRNARHALTGRSADAFVVPMGAWIDRVPTTPQDGHQRRRVVFLGHLVERQGVETLLRAIERLPDDVTADVIGTGPLEGALRAAAPDRATFHGYVEDHRDVERLLAEASVAVAPYRRTDETFTRYADPGKLKAYLAAGLPIVMTDVPPNARELADGAGAEIVADDPEALAAGIARALDGDAWQERRAAALAAARRFDWNVLLGDLLQRLRLSPEARG